MATKQNKTQKELESPVKGYQLVNLEDKLDDALKKLETILKNTVGIATTEYVDAKIKVVKDEVIQELKEHVTDEVSKVHLEYRPIKNGALWFAGIIVTAVIGIFVVTWNAIQSK